MSKTDQQDFKTLEERHPPGSKERAILDYSRGEHLDEELPVMLVKVFKFLMVISFVMGIAMVFGFLKALS